VPWPHLLGRGDTVLLGPVLSITPHWQTTEKYLLCPLPFTVADSSNATAHRCHGSAISPDGPEVPICFNFHTKSFVPLKVTILSACSPFASRDTDSLSESWDPKTSNTIIRRPIVAIVADPRVKLRVPGSPQADRLTVRELELFLPCWVKAA
jgi:hypothetical protein